MRRRRTSLEVPAELRVFNGHPYRTQQAWEAAYDHWCDVRDRWLMQRGFEPSVVAPPVDGQCPFDGTY